MKKILLFLTTFSILSLTGCSEDKAVSKSPTMGKLSISDGTHYTGQNATINVNYSDPGEHVYYSSSAKFTYTVTGPYGYTHTDSIPVYATGDVVPKSFSFPITLAETPGTYTLTLTTPYINKSAGNNTEGESIIFPRLSSSVTFNVRQAAAINANFGDSRDILPSLISVTPCTITGTAQDGTPFDSEGLSNTATTDEKGFTTQCFYKFIGGKLAEVEEQTSNAAATAKLDEGGKTIVESIDNDEQVSTIMDKTAAIFRLSGNQWELHQGGFYDTSDESLPVLYGNNILTTANTETQKKFLNDLIRQNIKSYSHIYKLYASDDESILSFCIVSIYATNGIIYISRRYVKSGF